MQASFTAPPLRSAPVEAPVLTAFAICKYATIVGYVLITQRDCNKQYYAVLKALCHTIRADYLLIEAARTHMVSEHWVWRTVADG